ncbi:MAG: DUF935 family protein [Kiritimatiellae bacterium]|nr:DUF935 family protein [Kiritimatiellia bacterium]
MGIITNIATRIAASAGSTLTRLRFNSWTMGGHGAEIFEKSAEALELERINPLRGVDEWRLGQIFDDARDGIYADLAWLYNEIEGVEPALVACCDMRESAASECGWLVKTADKARTRGFDQKLADDQRDTLLAEFGAVEDDLAELAGHLVSAFFRGAAHSLPLWNEDGTLGGFRHLDLWNFAFDRQTGIWYWNADASRDEGTFQPIQPGVLVSLAVSSSRHVDHAALPIFIRAALGAKRYGVWLDRFGIPPVGVIMPPNAERGEQQNYMDLARKFARGGSGVLPNGSAVTYGTEARAVCPFQDFIRFQQQQIYMVGIGRVQSGDNQGENLGGNAAGVVEGGFRRLVRRDARRIARAINDAVTAKVLERLFPGKPVLAQFAWDTEVKRTSREVLEDAGFAKNAGLAIDIDQVQELTGYKLTKAEEGTGNGERGTGFPGGPGGAGAPPSVPRFGLNAKTAFKNDEDAFKNARSVSGGQVDPSGQTPSQIAKKRPSATGEESHAEAQGGRERGEEVLKAFARDTGPAAKAVQELLKDFSKESCEKFLAELPKLVPDDPVTATVLADAMAEAMASQLSQGGEVANSTDAQGNEHGEAGSGKGGQFVAKGDGGGASGAPAAKPAEKPNADDLDTRISNVPTERIAEIAAGEAKGLITVEEGIAVVLDNPTFKDKSGREMKFDSSFASKYRYGHGRSMNESDLERFRHVQDAIYAVTHDEHPVSTFKGKKIMETTDLPRGSQRCYRTDTTNGETWAISWADKVYVRSIQERAKNNPPYKT